MKFQCGIAAALALFTAHAANAGFVVVDELGGPVVLNSAAMSDLFSLGPSSFLESDLAGIHSTLQSGGIQTDGKITFLLADTAAGLSFVTLIDSNLVEGVKGDPDSMLGLSSTAPSSLAAFINDDGDDDVSVTDLFIGLQVTNGIYAWDSSSEGDAFAWGGLGDGDSVSYHIDDLGTPAFGEGAGTFQFLDFDGEKWSVAATADFSSDGQFVFSFTAVPAPASAVVFAMAGFVTGRRRRRAA